MTVSGVPVRRVDLGVIGRPRTIGIAGIVLDVFAFLVALPPIEARTIYAPIAIGFLGLLCGVWAIGRGEKRLGWSVAIGAFLAIPAGAVATFSGLGNLETVFAWSALTAATLRFATPLIFAAIGGMFSERSGVVNIGLEGMMLTGAFFGIWGADKTGSWEAGLGIAMLAGGAMALLHAFFAISLRADQIVGGTAINFLAVGITGFLFIDIYGSNGTPSNIPEIPDIHLNFLGHIPLIGNFLEGAFGQMNLMIWLALALVVLSSLFMFRTPLGLRLRSVGEHPRAADTVGISVYRTRYLSVTFSGMLAALGGAYLSIGFVHSFNQDMSAGRGFIALAALIFGKWNPYGALGAACLFGFSSALAQRLPVYSGSAATLFQALPYVLTLIAVAGVIGRSIPPAAVGRPYIKQ
jgi:simple sugar transport system permease protein